MTVENGALYGIVKLDPSVKDKTPAEALNALRLEIDGMRRDLEAELVEWMRR